MARALSVTIAPREESPFEHFDDDDDNDSNDASSSPSDELDPQGMTEDHSSMTSGDESEVLAGEEDEPEEDSLKDISFGALASAQAKLSKNSRKRKLGHADQVVDDDVETKRPREDRKDIDYTALHEDARRNNQKPPSRSSKHAPMAISSKMPVSRRRAIFSPPPVDKFRDPRFDATVTADARRGNTSSTLGASKNYAFLSDYQAAEILDLKTQIKKSKDPATQADLKRQVMSLEAKLRNAQTAKREAEIRQEHNRAEKQAIREGKKAKPYFLKDSDVKKRIEQERQDSMGKRARDKSEKRKKKREKTKEARDMPRVRRGPY